jgi:hypothetical protein
VTESFLRYCANVNSGCLHGPARRSTSAASNGARPSDLRFRVLGLAECYVERLDALKHYYYTLTDMRADLVSIREGLSSAESGKLPHEQRSLSGLSEDITAVIVLLECTEEKLFILVPREEFASPT